MLNILPALRTPAVLRMSAQFRPELRAHFDGLHAEDLYLRFGTHCRAEVLDAYVAGIDFQTDVVLGAFDDQLALIGTAHVSPTGGEWELGISVLPAWRCRGIGTVLLRRSMQRARSAGADRVVMHCLAANQALTRLVSKAGARIVPRADEAEGAIALPASSLAASWGEMTEDQLAAWGYCLKAHLLVARRIGTALSLGADTYRSIATPGLMS